MDMAKLSVYKDSITFLRGVYQLLSKRIFISLVVFEAEASQHNVVCGYRILGIDYDKGVDKEWFIFNMNEFGPVVRLGFNF